MTIETPAPTGATVTAGTSFAPVAGLTARAAVTWRYLPDRRVRHALIVDASLLSGYYSTSLCGTSPTWFRGSDEWRGTGSQAEYERVEELRECGRCTRLLAPAEGS